MGRTVINTLKQKITNKQLTLGSWITLGHPAVAEIMSKAGFDWLTVDLEHSVITLREAEDLIRVIQLSGKSALVRLTSNDANQIKRIMDAGADGIIVPCVNSADEARKAINAVYYPPRGSRGVGLARAQGYGAGFQQYKQKLIDESIVIVQIEHINAVNNIESILQVEGVDGFIIGPYDLSASMGYPGDFEREDVKQAIKHVCAVARKLNMPQGIHIVEPDKQALAKAIEDGFTFIAYSLDIRMLDVACREGLQVTQKLTEEVVA